MYDSSLEKATELFIEMMAKAEEINLIDRSELMINVPQFLKVGEYQENVKILAKRRNDKWKKNY